MLESLFIIVKVLTTCLYLITLGILLLFGFNRSYLVYLFNKYKYQTPKPKSRFKTLPKVTIQLPIYNEIYVVERLISSVCNIDYPRELMEIQVLDDSNDQTTEIAKSCVDKYREQGFNLHYIHRDKRIGFKAGALQEGLKSAEGEMIAIFDADFIPPRDFLSKTVHFFTNPTVGIVQARVGHLNLNYSSLTIAQSIMHDGHYVIEQFARFYGGMFFNFNGTAGILRKDCITSAGGWQHDTLTEDIDLSYRAQLMGWSSIYLKDVVVEAELPADINSFKAQQYRWAMGGIQTGLKLLPGILNSKEISLKIKMESLFHLLSSSVYALVLLLLFLILPIAYFWEYFGWQNVIVFNLIFLSAGIITYTRFYIKVLKEAHGRNWARLLPYIPLSFAIGNGIAVNNTKAVIDAILGKRSEFVRTPKLAITSKDYNQYRTNCNTSMGGITLLEISLSLIFIILTLCAFLMGYFLWIPFLIIIQFGFIYISVLTICQNLRRNL